MCPVITSESSDRARTTSLPRLPGCRAALRNLRMHFIGFEQMRERLSGLNFILQDLVGGPAKSRVSQFFYFSNTVSGFSFAEEDARRSVLSPPGQPDERFPADSQQTAWSARRQNSQVLCPSQ